MIAAKNGRVDGIIMSVTGEAKDHSYMHKIRKKSIPLVFFDRVYDDVVASKVLTNDYESSFTATKHLLEQGCRKISYLVVNKNLSIGKMRMQGYRDALESSEIQFSEDLVIDCSNDMTSNMQLLSDIFQSKKPDGVFASVERLALASYYVCHDLNIQIGKDIKIVCFSSLEIAPLLNPSLSTITQPAFDMGKEAARILFRRLEDSDPNSHENVVLGSELIIRNSSQIK